MSRMTDQQKTQKVRSHIRLALSNCYRDDYESQASRLLHLVYIDLIKEFEIYVYGEGVSRKRLFSSKEWTSSGRLSKDILKLEHKCSQVYLEIKYDGDGVGCRISFHLDTLCLPLVDQVESSVFSRYLFISKRL